MYGRMHLYASLLLTCLGIPADTLENEVGEQGYCGGVNDFDVSEPPWSVPGAAVR